MAQQALTTIFPQASSSINRSFDSSSESQQHEPDGVTAEMRKLSDASLTLEESTKNAQRDNQIFLTAGDGYCHISVAHISASSDAPTSSYLRSDSCFFPDKTNYSIPFLLDVEFCNASDRLATACIWSCTSCSTPFIPSNLSGDHVFLKLN